MNSTIRRNLNNVSTILAPPKPVQKVHISAKARSATLNVVEPLNISGVYTYDLILRTQVGSLRNLTNSSTPINLHNLRPNTLYEALVSFCFC